ncbi:MAG: hypothetical protein RBG13Loki_0953 [Promethearchaeota archaeon CR_4]|nr:MAG: hypothetical protein RBG13Loki_0953 [Candidatus Lokiarchaeota archaeon CR_4]
MGNQIGKQMQDIPLKICFPVWFWKILNVMSVKHKRPGRINQILTEIIEELCVKVEKILDEKAMPPLPNGKLKISTTQGLMTLLSIQKKMMEIANKQSCKGGIMFRFSIPKPLWERATSLLERIHQLMEARAAYAVKKLGHLNLKSEVPA